MAWSNRGADPYSKVELRVQGYRTEQDNAAPVAEIVLTNGSELSILYPEFAAQAFTRVACRRSERTNGMWQPAGWWEGADGKEVRDAVLRPHESVAFPIRLRLKNPPTRVGVFVSVRDGPMTARITDGAGRVIGFFRIHRFQA